MPVDVPSALPLIAFVIGLAAAPRGAANAVGFAIIAALLWHFHRRASAAAVFVALGIVFVPHHQAAAPAVDRFTSIEARIDSDWASRDRVHMLRCPRFVADGRKIDAPITIYARFPPPPIEGQATIHAEGFLRDVDGKRYALSVKSPRLMSYRGSIAPLMPSTWNRVADERLRRHAKTNPEEIAMIEALVLGRGERLSDEAKQNFRRGGTYHLLVFSGLQIALAAAVIAFALRWAGAPRVSDWSLIVFAALAPPFIGPTASVSRSSIGIALYALSRVLKRPTSFANLWCVAALTRLILVPGDITDPAFHLTYAGAGALIFAGKPLSARFRWIGYAIAAEIVITPLTLFHFHQFALGGSLMTVVLTPIIFVMLVAGAAFCVTEVMALLHVIAALNALCLWLNDLAAPFSGFFAAPSPASIAAGLITALTAIAFASGRRRAIAVALAMTIPTTAAIATHLSQRTTSHPQVVFLDVGQGDSILLRSGAHNVLVDGGGRSDDTRFGETVLLPILVDRGVHHVDVVVLSHAHPDHCGGLPAVIEQLDVGELWINPRRFRGECAWTILAAAQRRGTPVRLVRDHQHATRGELRIDAITATRGFRRAAENNSSIVVRLDVRSRSFLLTGDIEREAEANLAPRIGSVDVLKVPHHGSRSSSTPALLDRALPHLAVISCGAHNWFGHPHADVLNTLRSRDIRTLRTDLSGTLQMDIEGPIFIHPLFDTPR